MQAQKAVKRSATLGNALLQTASIVAKTRAIAEVDSLAEREEVRQHTITDSLLCIERVFEPALSAVGWEEPECYVKEAVAQALLTVSTLPASASDSTLEEATAQLWKTYDELYCVASGNEGCSIAGKSVAEMHLEVEKQSTEEKQSLQPEESLIEHIAEEESNPGGPRCGSTYEETVRGVEKQYGLQTGSLAALGRSMQALLQRSKGEEHVLRLIAAQAADEAGALGLTQVQEESMGALPAALLNVLLMHDKLLRAVGEPSNLEKEESLQAHVSFLVGKGSCRDISVGTAQFVPRVVNLLVKQYMQLHCAANVDCIRSYTDVLTGAPQTGETLVQKAIGVAMKGGRLVAEGLVAASMRLFGIQHFDAEVISRRAAAASSFVSVETENLASRTAVKQLLQLRQVSARRLILAAADIMRCPAV